MATGSVTVRALYDRVSYKPQEALDATDRDGRRVTSYFDKGEIQEIPQKEYDRLTSGQFENDPAVEKVSASDAKAETAETTTGDGTDNPGGPAAIGQGAGHSESQAEAGTPLDPSGIGNRDAATTTVDTAALEAMTVKDLTRLARDNGVELAASDRKPDLVAKLSAANVSAPSS